MRLLRVGLWFGVIVAATTACAGGSDPILPSGPTAEDPKIEAVPDPGSNYLWTFQTLDDRGAKPSLAVGPNGVPHVAYMLEGMPGFVKYAVLEANSWSVSTVSTGYFYGPLDIQLDSDGVPHITYHSHDTEDLAYAVRRDDIWEVAQVVDPGHDGWDGSLAIGSGGVVQATSIDPSQFGSRSGVEYALFDGQQWSVEEIGSGPTQYEFGTSLALDSTGRPHVAWYDDSERALKLGVKDGGSWVISTVDSAGDVGRFPSLEIDSLDYPVITYYESLASGRGRIKFARWDGASWDIQVIDEVDEVALGHFGARKNSSLVLDDAGNPIVAYSDERVLKLAMWQEDAWHIEIVETAGSSPLGQQVSLALDGAGILHLTFAEVERKGSPGVQGAIRYARGTPKNSEATS